MLVKRTIKAVVCLGAGLVMYEYMNRTIPSRDEHVAAASQMVQRVIDKAFMDKIQFPEQSREIANYISNTLIPQATQKVMSDNLDIKSFGIASIGTIKQENGEEDVLSLGILGNVFTFGEDKIQERLEEYLSLPEMKEVTNKGNIK